MEETLSVAKYFNELFNATFQGWKYDPVLVEVRNEYGKYPMFHSVKNFLSTDAKQLVSSVYNRYKNMTSWKLSSLSHGELSWKCAREGLSVNENGCVALKLSDMHVDAARELLRRKTRRYAS